MREGHYPEGFIMDTIGSIVVDSAMDIIHEKLALDMEHLGLKVSNRYSPGYCSWDVSEQKKLFSFFPVKFAGISLSDSSLMNPIKSVSGIAGIGKDIKHLGYACNNCTMVDCVFRGLKD
jgi:chloramphenicol 3-O-phosphotransferase